MNLENAIELMMGNDLTETQTDEIRDFIQECMFKALSDDLHPSDVVKNIKENLSYNQLVFLSTMYIGGVINDMFSRKDKKKKKKEKKEWE